MEFSEIEKALFLRMVDYFISAEQKEIQELKLPSGNLKYVSECEDRLKVYETIKSKVRNSFNF